jgi:predicted ATPase
MRIKSVVIKGFRRFEHLEIKDLPPARLVVLAGPNGTGKSSLFDAFSVWRQAHGQFGISWQANYHTRMGSAPQWNNEQVKIDFYDTPNPKTAFYLRTAYRNDPDFTLRELKRLGELKEDRGRLRMLEGDATVSQNYQRLVSDAVEDIFAREEGTTTIAAFREGAIGDLQKSMLRLFPNLTLNTLGNPLEDGTFRFTKGNQVGFSYNNLSGGEKAAFDLLLDLIIKRRAFNNTVFAIDEPEAHMNSRLQGALLEELLRLIPAESQLWVATHSVGMMRKARELHSANPAEVVFLDFGDKDFDRKETLSPIAPTRTFWERVLTVALDDLAGLVAPRQVVICEGNPIGSVPGKNDEHDAQCYDIVFTEQRPDVAFVSAGNSKDVSGDRLKFAAVFPKVINGIEIRRLIDRDDHSPQDIAGFKQSGQRVLRRRHIESYLYDDEVLRALYEREDRLADFPAAQAAVAAALSNSGDRGNAKDDVKSAAAEIYNFLRKHLTLTAAGNDHLAFARNILAPLLRPGMQTYAELEADIFGQ